MKLNTQNRIFWLSLLTASVTSLSGCNNGSIQDATQTAQPITPPNEIAIGNPTPKKEEITLNKPVPSPTVEIVDKTPKSISVEGLVGYEASTYDCLDSEYKHLFTVFGANPRTSCFKPYYQNEMVKFNSGIKSYSDKGAFWQPTPLYIIELTGMMYCTIDEKNTSTALLPSSSKDWVSNITYDFSATSKDLDNDTIFTDANAPTFPKGSKMYSVKSTINKNNYTLYDSCDRPAFKDWKSFATTKYPQYQFIADTTNTSGQIVNANNITVGQYKELVYFGQNVLNISLSSGTVEAYGVNNGLVYPASYVPAGTKDRDWQLFNLTAINAIQAANLLPAINP